MTIKEIKDINAGDLVEIKSDAGGCDKAPCTKVVASTCDGGFASTDDDDRGYTFKLSMDNYIGTIDIAPLDGGEQKTIHQFSK